MPGVRGFGDPTAITLPSGKSVFYQPDPSNPDGYVLPFRLNTEQTTAAAIEDPTHDWTPQHQAWANGAMDDWVPVHIAYDGATNGPLCMGYYNEQDIPFHWALAKAFTLCDNYHCSVFGPTVPNRLYVWTGMIDPNGTGGGPVISDGAESTPDEKYTWLTYAEQLQAAGVSWRNYQQTDNGSHNALAWFKSFEQASTSSPLYQRGIAVVDNLVEAFSEDVRTGNLPQVSWLIGPYGTCEHPSQLPAAGAVFISELREVTSQHSGV